MRVRAGKALLAAVDTDLEAQTAKVHQWPSNTSKRAQQLFSSHDRPLNGIREVSRRILFPASLGSPFRWIVAFFAASRAKRVRGREQATLVDPIPAHCASPSPHEALNRSGGSTAYLMGNAAYSSCCWWRGVPTDNKKTDGDGKDGDSTWIKQGSVPLVTARYDSDDIDTECVVKKTVVMRAPRPASASVSSVPTMAPTLSSRSSARRTKSDDAGSDDTYSNRVRGDTTGGTSPDLVSDPRDRVHSSGSSNRNSSSRHSSSAASASSASSPRRRKKSRATGLRPLDPPSDDEPKSPTPKADDVDEPRPRDVAVHTDTDADAAPYSSDSPRHGEVSEDQLRSTDDIDPPAALHSDYDCDDSSHHRHHHREDSSRQHQQDADDQLEQEEEPPRSPRSTRSASHDSTGSTTPKRKGRYGRKSYRANSNRKKTH